VRIPLFQVDAFARSPFTGNPAAVCPLERWLGDDVLQSIAAENNLSETAFFVSGPEGRELRWFTPTTEVALCGHATLASGFVVLDLLGEESDSVSFRTRSGSLLVSRTASGYAIDLPVLAPHACEPGQSLLDGLDRSPIEILASTNYLCVYERQEDILNLHPNFRVLKHCEPYGVIVTAPGDEVDFVSRFFAPAHGIDEDPVTGSAHCTLTPYWSQRLRKTRMEARQLSPRGGELACTLEGERVILEGGCVLVVDGTLHVAD
jgi:predicted PhzF superfamily epimerase YddE/YHI9